MDDRMNEGSEGRKSRKEKKHDSIPVILFKM